MSRVCSIDSEGIVKACTRNVTTKTAITTVPATDWIVAGQSSAEIFSLHDITTAQPSRPVGRVMACLQAWPDIPTEVVNSLLGRSAILPYIWMPRLGQRSQMLQHLARGFLLSPLLGRALSAPHEPPHLRRRQPHLDGKGLLVFRPLFFYESVNRLWSASGLQRLL